MKVYHYAKLQNWREIRDGSYKSDDVPGLGPYQRLNPLGYPGDEIICSFSLFHPYPNEYVNNKYFPYFWNGFKYKTGPLLVEVNTESVEDSVYVVDWAHIQGRVERNRKIPRKYKHRTEERAREAYFKSMVPVSNYLKEKDNLNYCLPEVIITKVVPFTDLLIPKEQKRLDDRFDNLFLREDTLLCASFIPELADWYIEHKKILSKEGGPHIYKEMLG